jgi:outer membrane protein TolC
MSKNKVYLSILCISLFGACSVSQAIENTTNFQNIPTRLNEAIDVALRNRLEVVIASKQRTSAAIKVKVAKGKYLPQIALSGTSKYLRALDTFSGIEADASLGNQKFHVSVQNNPPVYTLNTGLDLTYNIFSGGRDTAALEETIAEQTALQHEESATKTSVSLDVMNTYWMLRKSQILTRLAERAYIHGKKLERIAETRRVAGHISEKDAETEAFSAKEFELAFVEARHDEARNLTKYQTSLGLCQSDNQSPAAKSVSLIDDPENIGDADLLPATDRPETLRLKSEAIAAETRVRQAKAAYLPTIDFFANYKMVGRDNDNYIRSARLRSDYYTVGVTVSFILFDGFRDRIALAKSEEEVAHLRVMQNIRQLNVQNYDMIIEKNKLQSEVVLAEQRVQLYKTRKQLAVDKYNNGKISEIELYEAEKNYADFEDKLMISKIDAAIAKLTLSINNLTN